MLFHKVLAGIQLLILASAALVIVLTTGGPTHNYLIDVLFWAWFALCVGAKIKLLEWSKRFQQLSGASALAALLTVLIAWCLNTLGVESSVTFLALFEDI